MTFFSLLPLRGPMPVPTAGAPTMSPGRASAYVGAEDGSAATSDSLRTAFCPGTAGLFVTGIFFAADGGEAPADSSDGGGGGGV